MNAAAVVYMVKAAHQGAQQTMQNKFNSFISRLTFWSITTLGVIHGVCAFAQSPTNRAVSVTPSSELKNVFYYEVQFPGGNANKFFQFWRTNGFTNDTVLFAGEAGGVYIPSFKIKDARLEELAQAIEFVTEDKLKVNIVPPADRDRGNIWKIRLAGNAATPTLKTKACAMPSLLSQENPNERIQRIIDQVEKTVIVGAEEISRGNTRVFLSGRCTILESEKIVVVVGSEAYVEAMASALDAAEQVAQKFILPPPKKSQ